MAALLALIATILTSFLPILNKRLLQDARPALVAWVVNAASLPILLGGTLLLTQCSVTSLQGSIPFSCSAPTSLRSRKREQGCSRQCACCFSDQEPCWLLSLPRCGEPPPSWKSSP